MKNSSKLTRMVMLLPIIPVRNRTGGDAVGRASAFGMQGFFYGLGLLGLVAYFWFCKWYQRHPILGKIIIGLVVIWVLWWIICWIRSFNDDPYLRKEPYRKIYLDEENIKFNPMNEQNPNPKEKDETRS